MVMGHCQGLRTVERGCRGGSFGPYLARKSGSAPWSSFWGRGGLGLNRPKRYRRREDLDDPPIRDPYGDWLRCRYRIVRRALNGRLRQSRSALAICLASA